MLTVKIDTGNDALVGNPQEVSRLVQRIASQITHQNNFCGGTVRDANGNCVGEWDYTSRGEEDE